MEGRINMAGAIKGLVAKINIRGKLTLLTGMHIGSSKDFSPIGAVDSVVVRDPVNMQPIIPGSSIKGKMRSLLARSKASNFAEYKDIDEKDPALTGLFGCSSPVRHSKLQFHDLALTEEGFDKLKNANTDLYLTEIKFENSINRINGIANPRQIERVPAGAEFDLNITYNYEAGEDIEADFREITRALILLQQDYLGGSGSRGYGRVKLTELKAETGFESEGFEREVMDPINEILKEAEGV
jgi:CRISPR-associated protein Csm3